MHRHTLINRFLTSTSNWFTDLNLTDLETCYKAVNTTLLKSIPLRSRDFFAAAAYTQLLNLSMQPGWSLDLRMHLPRGYSFTYFNDEVEREGSRGAVLHVDALEASEDVHKVFLASITHRKMVAFALLAALWGVGLVAAFPLRFLYGRYRLPRMKAK